MSALVTGVSRMISARLCRTSAARKYYQQTVEDDDLFASGAYWCGKPQEAFGPDGQPAGKKECAAGRTCFAG